MVIARTLAGKLYVACLAPAADRAIPSRTVEQPCYQCGAPVEDGVAFCRQCNAPQIRVGDPAAASDLPSHTPSLSHSASQTGIQWSQALPATALAGLIAGFVIVPLGAFGIGMIAAGVLSVLFYRRRHPGVILSPGSGARLGAVSGVLGFVMFAILTSLEMLMFRSGGQVRQALLETIQQSASRTNDPQVQQMFDYFKTPAGLALMMGLGLTLMLVLFVVLSSLGGALTTVLLRKRERN